MVEKKIKTAFLLDTQHDLRARLLSGEAIFPTPTTPTPPLPPSRPRPQQISLRVFIGFPGAPGGDVDRTSGAPDRPGVAVPCGYLRRSAARRINIIEMKSDGIYSSTPVINHVVSIVFLFFFFSHPLFSYYIKIYGALLVRVYI